MNKFVRTTFFITILFTTVSIYALSVPVPTHATSANEIQSKITARNNTIKALQDEITRYQKQLNALGFKQTTLESAIHSLKISREKLNANLNLTTNKISSADLQLEQLKGNIKSAQSNIDSSNSAISAALRTINQNDAVDESPLTLILNTKGLSDAWTTADRLSQFNEALGNNVKALTRAKTNLASTKKQVASTRTKLIALKQKQISQRKSIDANTYAQRRLLRRTKNKESSYQKLIADKRASEKSFEQELEMLQSQLKLIVNSGTLPKAGNGILSWPFSAHFMKICTTRKKTFGNLYCITQYFGNTPFSTKNPQVYNGHGHNAIDIAAPIGTPIHAALTGVILDTGNTDLAHDSKGRQCWSFGKWVMIKHPDGLNTMYAHMSEIDVSKGQSVSTGQIIGYSGMTGYATGPHIHFGVYATDGTKIMTLGKFHGVSGTRCANAKMPVATLDAYLNPLSYLPH